MALDQEITDFEEGLGFQKFKTQKNNNNETQLLVSGGSTHIYNIYSADY